MRIRGNGVSERIKATVALVEQRKAKAKKVVLVVKSLFFEGTVIIGLLFKE